MNTELNSIKGKKILVIGDVMLDTSLKKSNVYLMFAMLWKEVITKP